MRHEAIISLGKNNKLVFEPHPPPATPETAGEHATLIAALIEYLATVQRLRSASYGRIAQLLPPHLASPSRLYVFSSDAGIFLRWVPSTDLRESEIYYACCEPLHWQDLIAILSSGYIRVEDWISDRFPHIPELSIEVRAGPPDTEGREIASGPIGIKIPNTIPSRETRPHDSFRPFCAIAVTSAHQVRIHAELTKSGTPPVPEGVRYFTDTPLSLEWSEIQLYTPEEIGRWTPELAPAIAERDLLFVLAHNAIAQNMDVIQALEAQRRWFWQAVETLVAFADAKLPEEVLHQHIRAFPWILAFNASRVMSKVPFGRDISDFVIEHADGRYELVELEASSTRLMTKSGDPTAALNHALNQIRNWTRYIEDNKRTVEEELDLRGISSNCSRRIIIGRAAELDQKARRTLQQMEGEHRNLKIHTWDELIETAKAALLRAYGPDANFFPVGSMVLMPYRPPPPEPAR